MNPMILSLFISALGLGTTITLSSYHWVLAWMGLEMNTLAIIPLMAKLHHPRAIEATTKYFLTQAAASALILFSSLTNAWITGEWAITNLTNTLSIISITIALSMKLGLAPFHFWLPEVIQGLDLMTGLILSTWQKLAPMALLYLISPNLNFTILLTLAIFSTLIGGWGGMNQTQLRKVLAYSSIAHLGWMTIILIPSPQLTMLNLIIYILMTSSMFLVFKTYSTTKISSLSLYWTKAPAISTMTILVLLSLGGLPPLSGFLPKWMIIQELSNQGLMLPATIIALSALLSLFFYLRLSYTSILTIPPNTSNSPTLWRSMSTQPKMFLSTTIIASTCFLPISPMIMSALN
uniref:NADH-ubiquinone oxidoreductase chain 2 n=1 Tax=Pelodytes cf. punctatus II-2011 TaxID=1005956 RepID=K9JYW3_9ANUR|nr:NADH dehydrogenase subunit 2 [Pelodytes cf. punctatus II-2011]AEC33163.1 NADH dehydrogenase subunit 2 [Pelodytes cf. punctatus II-2011]